MKKKKKRLATEYLQKMWDKSVIQNTQKDKISLLKFSKKTKNVTFRKNQKLTEETSPKTYQY